MQLITKSSGDVRSNTKAPWGISTEMFVQAMQRTIFQVLKTCGGEKKSEKMIERSCVQVNNVQCKEVFSKS